MEKVEGYTKLPNDLQKAIQANKFNGSEMSVLLCVVRLTIGYNLKEREISSKQISEMLSISERTVKRATKRLKDRKVLLSKPSGKNNGMIYSVNFCFSEWSSSDKLVTTSSDKLVTTSSDKLVTTSSDKLVTPSSYYIKDNSFKDNSLKTTATQKAVAVFEKMLLISGAEKRQPNRHESELLEKWQTVDGFSDEDILAGYVKAKEQGMRDALNLSYIDKVLTDRKTKTERKPKSETEAKSAPSYDLAKAEQKSRTGVPKLLTKEERMKRNGK